MQITKSIAAIAAALSCALLLGSVFVIGTARADDAAENNAAGCAIEYYGAYEGYDNVSEWENEMEAKKTRRQNYLDGILVKINERDDVDWSDVRSDVIKIRQDLDHAYSLASLDEIKTELNKLDEKVDKAISDRDEEIAAEEEAARIAEEEAAAAAYYEEYYYDYGYSGGDSGYHPTGGLTPQSGVNYYGDQRETYYSSNVLYHYQTSQWTVDDEGFYREGDYYVVAANDGQHSNGDTYEGSKGTCIVRDSGCDYGTTDYYVAW